MSKIEWTGERWNPIVGCSLATPGCTNCYAMTMASRLEAMGTPAYQGLTQPSKAGPVWTGKLAFSETALLKPLQRKKPQTYFVNSMGDLFHEDCLDEWIDRVFAVMALCPQHTFQVLTKRSERMREYCNGLWQPRLIAHIREISQAPFGQGVLLSTVDGSLSNVWLGVSVEDQKRADERIPDLLATHAAIRWISAEPLLGPVDLRQIVRADCCELDALLGWDSDQGDPTIPRLDWVVVGGESGKDARPMHPDWARSLRDQCAAADVPFFFKQWGEWMPVTYFDGFYDDFDYNFDDGSERVLGHVARNAPLEDHGGKEFARLGKKRGGRLLDGKPHDEYPRQHGSKSNG